MCPDMSIGTSRDVNQYTFVEASQRGYNMCFLGRGINSTRVEKSLLGGHDPGSGFFQ